MRSHTAERTGAAIRKLRLAKGWTLAELSAESGVPLSTLSRVELGQNALNYDKLTRLCRALDVDLQGLVTREAEARPVTAGRRAVVRAGDGAPFRLGPHTGHLAGDDLLDRAFTPVMLNIAVADLEAHGAKLTAGGEAYLKVLVGTVVLHSDVYAPLTLSEGDAVYFDARAPFALTAEPAAGARVLLVLDGDGLTGD
jgi:transcriptional regulator with XRE-family HTH domain